MKFSSQSFAKGAAIGAFALAGAFCVAPHGVYAAEAPATVDLLSPVAATSLRADTLTKISWAVGDTDAAFVNLYYSADAGATWSLIARNTPNDGSYSWMVAHVQSDEVVVKIAVTDLADEFATDVSGAFSVWFYGEDNSGYWDNGAKPPVEARTDIDGIQAGDFIATEGSSDISYVDESLARRPLFTNETYFTYEESTDAVIEVSENTMHKFTLGAPLAPKAGTVLVKTPSLSRVYWIEEDMYGTPELRWVTSEAVAEEMFGEDWSAYVLDIEPSVFVRFAMGADIDAAYAIDRTAMKQVAQLHE